MKENQNSISIIIPAYNEEEGLAILLPKLIEKQKRYQWEIVVVNDGSRDKTEEVVKKFTPNVLLINHKVNSGYGASIKSGIRLARSHWIATFDADGQHQVSDLEKLIAHSEGFDAVIGIRKNADRSNLQRVPGKLLLRYIFTLITGYKIKDINCGLRVIKRKVMFEIFGLTCDRFSFSTSTTVALLNLGYAVNFIEINVNKRIGKSTVRQLGDGLQTILLIIRLVMLFNPLRVFLPVAGFLLILGFVYQVVSFLNYGFAISKLALFLVICGIMLFLFALQQDQVSALRREVASFALEFTDTSDNKDKIG